MSEDGRIATVAIICAALLLGGLILGGFRRSREQTRAISDCVKAGRAPLECRVAIERSL